MQAFTKELQGAMTPDSAIERLKEGNDRFVKGQQAGSEFMDQVSQTSGGQFPFAALLSCIDSRAPAELLFDQGIGDVFNARLAGNIVNEDVLGSLEYACKVAGSKLIVVMGHTKCGAVTAACKQVKLGNITPLLDKIQPAVNDIVDGDLTDDMIERVAVRNVERSIQQMRDESAILNELESEGAIKIVGAIYDVASGKVNFL